MDCVRTTDAYVAFRGSDNRVARRNVNMKNHKWLHGVSVSVSKMITLFIIIKLMNIHSLPMDSLVVVHGHYILRGTRTHIHIDLKIAHGLVAANQRNVDESIERIYAISDRMNLIVVNLCNYSTPNNWMDVVFVCCYYFMMTWPRQHTKRQTRAHSTRGTEHISISITQFCVCVENPWKSGGRNILRLNNNKIIWPLFTFDLFIVVYPWWFSIDWTWIEMKCDTYNVHIGNGCWGPLVAMRWNVDNTHRRRRKLYTQCVCNMYITTTHCLRLVVSMVRATAQINSVVGRSIWSGHVDVPWEQWTATTNDTNVFIQINICSNFEFDSRWYENAVSTPSTSPPVSPECISICRFQINEFEWINYIYIVMHAVVVCSHTDRTAMARRKSMNTIIRIKSSVDPHWARIVAILSSSS